MKIKILPRPGRKIRLFLRRAANWDKRLRPTLFRCWERWRWAWRRMVDLRRPAGQTCRARLEMARTAFQGRVVLVDLAHRARAQEVQGVRAVPVDRAAGPLAEALQEAGEQEVAAHAGVASEASRLKASPRSGAWTG